MAVSIDEPLLPVYQKLWGTPDLRVPTMVMGNPGPSSPHSGCAYSPSYQRQTGYLSASQPSAVTGSCPKWFQKFGCEPVESEGSLDTFGYFESSGN